MQIRNPLLSHDKTVHTDRAVPDAFVDVANGIAGLDAAGKVPWANVTKTGSNLTEIATRSHTALSDIGTNTHAQIDTAISTSTTHIAAATPHSGPGISSNLNGSRSLGTVYQNTTGREVVVTATITEGTGRNVSSFVDSVVGCTNQIGMLSFGAGSYGMVTFLVPNNYYYKILTGFASTISYWFES